MEGIERYSGQHSAVAVYRPANVSGAFRQEIPAWVFGVAHQQVAPAAGGPNVAQAQAREPSGPGGVVPFRRATTFRTQRIATTGPQAMTAAQQNIEVQIDGSGYVQGIDLDVTCTTAGNVAAVAYQEDAPWSAIASIIYKDVTGELINLPGFDLRLCNLYGGWRPNGLEVASADATVFLQTAGAGATGGSFRFHLYVPVATNPRDLYGVLGNQSREQRYYLRDDIAPDAAVYTVNPTALGNVTIARNYESWTVPQASNALGNRQAQVPDKFGILHYLTRSLSPSAPAGGATVQHYLQRLGNVIRYWILVLRSNGTRALAEASIPTLISLYIGDIPVFSMTPAEIRMAMFNRYGFDAPAGVFVFDSISQDFALRNGGEMGEDYFWTKGLNQAYLEIVYPAGFGAANNSLVVITDDLQVPTTVDLYA